MKISGLRCAVIGKHPTLRITTDEGISGYSQIESSKAAYIKSHVMFYEDKIVGHDPTDVERVMQQIRRLGSFKPWGSAVSAIEMALWDIAGKSAGLPVYKLLGGKVRDKVRCYNGSVRVPMDGKEPQHYAENMAKMKELPQKFSIIKQGVAFHSGMPTDHSDFFYGENRAHAHHLNRGTLTPKGFKHLLACIDAMLEVCGDDVELALDCGPGMMVPDAIRLAQAVEGKNVAWLEDMLTGDYVPYTLAQNYREVTQSTSTRIHTGEQIFLRQNFVELIEKRCLDVVGPDPCDIGGIAELKWVAEYADLHDILMAPHGTIDGLFGLAALVQVGATMPNNYIAFEYPTGDPEWWYDIVEGLPNPIVVDSYVDVLERPGIGIDFRIEAAKKYLTDGDKNFFD
ncbi:MAG: mandelate racemase/muconate lactonizing enzyme family protein [Candidatus Latescibacterota bacterium]|nr:mandelate racemase/muconate lactonizing enzyme family protein [Candidatus Latescibacterota bacterium]